MGRLVLALADECLPRRCAGIIGVASDEMLGPVRVSLARRSAGFCTLTIP